MPRTILITGAAGFVGTHLLKSLLSDTPTPRIVGWKRPNTNADEASHRIQQNKSVEWHAVDILQSKDVINAVAEARPTEIFHCAGIASAADAPKNITRTLAINVLGTRHLMQGLKLLNTCTRIVLPSSATVYRPKLGQLNEHDEVGPITPYGLSKLAQEMQSLRFVSAKQQVVITRSFTHIGPGQSLAYAASSFAYQVASIEADKKKPVIHVGRLDTKRDIMDVRDTVMAYRALMSSSSITGTYNVCSGRTHQMRDIVMKLIDLAHVPIETQIDQKRFRTNDYPDLSGDRTKITKAVGWSPQITLDQTLNDLLNYWRAQV
ncbi:NAD-dependent epimerase/dehydratase family protein [bacterium]|nr:MAG: NAD-dependent epimerase/dehydratase family protein [bacterium]